MRRRIPYLLPKLRQKIDTLFFEQPVHRLHRLYVHRGRHRANNAGCCVISKEGRYPRRNRRRYIRLVSEFHSSRSSADGTLLPFCCSVNCQTSNDVSLSCKSNENKKTIVLSTRVMKKNKPTKSVIIEFYTRTFTISCLCAHNRIIFARAILVQVPRTNWLLVIR